MKSVMTAEHVGRAAIFDKQLAIPRRPRLRLGVRVAWQGEAIVLQGAPKVQRFSGAFASEHLITMAGLCDGTRDVSQIATALGIPHDAAFKALALLWTSGAIEEGDQIAPQLENDMPTHARVLLSRLGDSTAANSAWENAATRLAQARVRIVGDSELVADLTEAIRDVITPVTDGERPTLIVFAEVGDMRADRHLVSLRAWADGVPFLRLGLAGELAIAGPYVDPSFTPCCPCADARDPALGATLASVRRAGVGVLARELVSLLTRATATHLPGDDRHLNLLSAENSYVSPTTRPGCPTCGQASGPVSGTAPLGSRYEASVAIPPGSFVDRKGHQAHFRSSNLALQYEFRDWPSCPPLDLPAPELNRLDVAWSLAGRTMAPGPLTLGDLSLILMVGFGLKRRTPGEPKVRRWTAAGGNIGSVTAYVAIRDPRIAAPGTYAYVDSGHRLARVSDETTPGTTPFSIILTGNVGKVSQKYFSFAFRVCIQDGACSATSATLAAEAIGIELTPVADWNDAELRRVCRLSDYEPATGVLDWTNNAH